MKLSQKLTLAGLGVGALTLALVQGCSSSSSGGGGGPSGSVGGPPAKPTAPATTSTTEHNYVLYQLFLGDTDRSGTPSDAAWKSYGYNLDGKVTDKTSTDVCTQAHGASKTMQADGLNGIDNSFGENLLKLILSTAGNDAAKKINDSIQQGHFSVMIDTVGLDDAAGAGQTATGLTGKLFAGANFDAIDANKGKTPTFTMADNWPVRPELLNGGDINSPKVKFTDSFVVNGNFVTGSPPGDLTLSLAFGGVALDLTVHAAVVTFDHTGAGVANNGIIAGVINTDELVAGLRKVAGRISTSLCSGSAFDSIALQIQQGSDIMHDGTNAQGTPCDAISIGLGFTGKEISKPQSVAPLSSPAPDPCTSGGGGDAGGGSQDAGTD